MAQDRIPVPRRLLVLPGGAGTGSTGPAIPGIEPAPVPPVPPVLDPSTGPSTGVGADPSTDPAVPVLAATGVPMAVPERARLAIRSAAEGTAVVWKPYASFAVMLCTAKPGSMAEHRQHIKSRAWVPADLTGKAATIITWAGILHHLLIARPVKAAAKTVDAAADKALRFYSLIAVLIVLFFLLSHYL